MSHSVAMSKFLGSDALDWDVTFERGESRIEPGYLPAHNLTVCFGVLSVGLFCLPLLLLFQINLKTFTQMGYECGQSRLWAGVHFQDAIDSIKEIATTIGNLATDLVVSHFNAEPAPHYGHAGPHGHSAGYGHGYATPAPHPVPHSAPLTHIQVGQCHCYWIHDMISREASFFILQLRIRKYMVAQK